MNTNPQTPNGTFRFIAVVQFDIDPDTAASLLVESDPWTAIGQWINNAKAVDDSGACNQANLRDGLDKYLGEQAIERARALLPSADVKLLEGE